MKSKSTFFFLPHHHHDQVTAFDSVTNCGGISHLETGAIPAILHIPQVPPVPEMTAQFIYQSRVIDTHGFSISQASTLKDDPTALDRFAASLIPYLTIEEVPSNDGEISLRVSVVQKLTT